MDTRRPNSCTRERWLPRSSAAAPLALLEHDSLNWSAEQVYHAHYHRIVCLALRLLGNEADAEDVAQEVILQVVRKLHTFRGQSALSTWLHRVTVNAARRHRRQQAHPRERPLAPPPAPEGPQHDLPTRDGAMPDHLALRKELSQRIDHAVSQLPPDYRVVYIAADVDGLPNAEISDRLGLSLAAVKSRLHRGRTMLRAILAPYYHGPRT